MEFKSSHLGVFICKLVFEGAAILHVSHDGNGDWQFLCGSEDHNDGGEKAIIAGISHLVERDPTLVELESLPIGWRADRKSLGEDWEKKVIKD